jgi:replication initiator protein RepSA
MEKLLLTVWEAADVLSVSRSRVYELLHAEQPVWTGGRVLRPRHRRHAAHLAPSPDHLDADPDAGPVHVMRFGTHHDIAGIIAPSADADRAVRYLAKYLTKAIGDPLGDNSESDPAREAHIDRLHAELRWLPCSPRCANWLRYGIQPDQPSPGRCPSKAHDREPLGIGGRRVLVSRDWSGLPRLVRQDPVRTPSRPVRGRP